MTLIAKDISGWEHYYHTEQDVEIIKAFLQKGESKSD